MKTRFLALMLLASALFADDLRRFALFVGADEGGAGRATLKYAVSDAKALQGVLTELGGLAAEDSRVLGNPDKPTILKALESFSPRIAAGHEAGGRAEFLFYYSGHSDEDGLLLGNSKLGYGELRDALAKLGADVRLAVLDSCASGAFTRLKGGTKAAPFLQDESSALEGHAYLTSSSEDEASQESDKIGGSFFTHYLISGLRGAADTTGDGRVSLNEAYRHAFDETLARTEDTQSGPQHPSYEIQLTGTGDLVLTDLTVKTSRLVLASDVSGQVFVRTAAGNLVAEVHKKAGEAMTLAVPAGNYVLAVQTASGYGQATRTIGKGESTTLVANDLASQAKQATRVRGPGSLPVSDPEFILLNLGLTPWIEMFPEQPKATVVSIHGLVSRTTVSRAFQFAGLVSIADVVTGFQGSGIGNVVSSSLKGFEFGGIFNVVQGEVAGGQFGGIFNVANGNQGAQLGGIFNVSKGSVFGAQLAGIFNTNEELRGAQLAGIFNFSHQATRGIQLAGIINVAGDVGGVQMAGIINVARNVQGFQFGLINIARHVEGMSFGLLNIADNTYARLGTDFDSYGGTWTTLEWGAGTLHNVLIAPPGSGLFGYDASKPFGVGLGLGWGRNWRLEMQGVSFFSPAEDWAVTPGFRMDLLAKLGPLGLHAGWLATAWFPGYTHVSSLTKGGDVFSTDLFTPGYTWQIIGRPFVGVSLGF